MNQSRRSFLLLLTCTYVAFCLVVTAASGQLIRPSSDDQVPDAPVETQLTAVERPSRASSFAIRRNVVYKQIDFLRLKADLFIPKGEGPFPAVVLLHAGGWKAGSKKQMLYHGKRLAPRGYVAMSIDYRLAPRHPFPAQIEDCRSAVQFLRREAVRLKLDASRIAAFGYSAGGHLACLLGTEPDGGVEPSWRVQTVVAGGAPCDFEIVPPDARILAYWLGGSRSELPNLYRQASPLGMVSSDDAPTLLFHGSLDALVPTFSARRMHDRLREAGVRSEFVECVGKGHYRTFLDAGAFERAVEFLDSELQQPLEPPAD